MSKTGNQFKFKWISNHKNRNIDKSTRLKIQEYFKSDISQLFDSIIERYEEVPFSYQENSFSGFLAQAASKKNWYAITDYVDYNDRGNKTYRPDIYLSWAKGQHRSMVVEVKKGKLTLDSAYETFFWRMGGLLEAAFNQLKAHKNKSEAEFKCSLGVTYIICSQSRWVKIKSQESYDQVIYVLTEKILEVMRNKRKWKIKPNFLYQYFLDRNINSHKKILNNSKPQSLGVIVLGFVEKNRDWDFPNGESDSR